MRRGRPAWTPARSRGQWPSTWTPSSAWADAWAASIARPGVLEDRHQPVAEALDDLAAARADLRLDRGADLAQQRHGLGVAGVERPGREVREVGEDDRQLAVAAAAALGLGEALPHLQRAHPDLAQRAGLLGGQRRQAAAEHGGRLVAGERERVAVALVAGQAAAAEPEELDEAGVRVDALEEPAQAAGGFLAHRADFRSPSGS